MKVTRLVEKDVYLCDWCNVELPWSSGLVSYPNIHQRCAVCEGMFCDKHITQVTISEAQNDGRILNYIRLLCPAHLYKFARERYFDPGKPAAVFLRTTQKETK